MSSNLQMKILAKETAIYGVSSIVGKFLNWLLVPLYTYVLQQQSDYGIVTNLYAWTALLLVILTYGMETGFFRFANKAEENPKTVYSTSLIALFTTSLLFAVACVVWRMPIANALGYPTHSEFIALLGIVVAMDAFASIPFAYLRYKKRPLQFAALKLLFVFLNIILNLFFLVLCPKIQDWAIISSWYHPDYGVGYVFVANILATGIQTLCLLPAIVEGFKNEHGLPTSDSRRLFSGDLLKRMLRYSLPLLVLGVCGIMNQTLDRILFPFFYDGADAQAQLGIYGACFKVAMVMMMFTQAFRYAYEPFVFAKHKDRESVEAYADAMKYYIIFSYMILLGMIFYLDLLKFIIAPSYWEGLKVVPVVLWTYIFQGVYFNLSFWYKLTDKTQWGAYFSIIGVVITFALQAIFVPRIGYMASAASSTVCYLVIMLLSYFVGRKHLEIPYDLRRIGIYTLLVLTLLAGYYGLAQLLSMNEWTKMGLGTILFITYSVLFYRLDGKTLIKKK
ncbi:MAG: polysaccharide biosynthesis C-terminal domain-containing protein [Paludibacteraceae bacterium]|nr:polysaccharide biosynthesis C-terminal domain-containing protein [Paludibacteraceae bacterium]